MAVDTVVYANEDEDQVTVTLDDDKVWQTAWPAVDDIGQMVQDWVDDGGTIGAYTDPNDYMQMMRDERDRRMDAIQWRIQRNYRQIQNSETPTDDGTKMTEIYTYMKDLADMPQDNPDCDTKAEYDALTWPTEPTV